MHKINRREQRRALYGWVPYAPLVAVVFGVLFCDAWLNIQTRRTDYELGRLNRRMRELRAELDALRGEQAEREGIGLLGDKAAALGLVEPEPRQVMRITYDKRSVVPREQAPMTIAHLNASEDRRDAGRQDHRTATILLDAPKISSPHSDAAVQETAAPAFRLTRAPMSLSQRECLSPEGESLLPDVMAAINQARAEVRPEPPIPPDASLDVLGVALSRESMAQSPPTNPPHHDSPAEDIVLAPLLADLDQELKKEWKLLNASL